MTTDPVTLSVALTAISTSLGAFYQVMPPIGEVRSKGCHDRKFAADVRVGEVMSVFISLGVGGIIAALTNSTGPLILAALFATGMVAFYEYTLRSDMLMEEM